MPHLKIDYSANLDAHTDMGQLCRALAATLAGLRDARGEPLFPLAGSRVLACPAPHHAVAGGRDGYGFVYLNCRITPGRERALVDAAGDALLATVKAHFAPLLAERPLGITLHIDELAPAYEGKFSNLAAQLARGPFPASNAPA
ncbi:MAG: 5-carboxymethyl-2-hydroxymuconate isomerase [Pseudomonadota bacterium]|nr:5-carboxymethyl-2-hydroxymuconate isomerase [Pseudomonadota bacterium]